MMKRLLILMLSTLLLFSCARGKTEHFPTGANHSKAAEVFIIRNNNLFGWGFSLKVAFDDNIIARLRRGEHIHFFVDPGFHALGISEPTITSPFEPGQKYYFLISADYTQFGFEIERIDNKKGANWVAKTKPLK
jgi:hypothetical protein